jgi:hypothetical protein
VDLDDGGHVSGTTTPTLLIGGVSDDDMGSYRCVVTDDNGSVTSQSAALLPPRTAITQHPESQEVPRVPPASNVVFTVAAEGDGTITYRWQKDQEDLSDDGHYSGATTSTLTISDVHSEDDGAYRCRVSASCCGTVYSDEALLKVATADFDADNDVDQEDFGHFQACLTGTSVPQTDPTCMDASLDGDFDVDASDFDKFRLCLSGPGCPVDPECLD